MSEVAKSARSVSGTISGEEYVLEDQIGHVLRRANQRATAIFMEIMGDAQLTPTQYAALVKIRDVGQISQNRLGRLTAMDPATIKGVIGRLRKRGLVTSRPDRSSRIRRSVLELTPEGAAIVETALPRGRAVTEATLAPLGMKERKQLLALLRRIT